MHTLGDGAFPSLFYMDEIFLELKSLAASKGWAVEGGAKSEIDLVSPCRKFLKKFEHDFDKAAASLALEWLRAEGDRLNAELLARKKKNEKKYK